MQPETKQKWLDALRSGKYKQTRDCLKNNDGYCCLGVLCYVVGLKPVDLNFGNGFIFPNGQHRSSTISHNFEDIPSNIEDDLIDMNDHKGNNFNQIADYIEKAL